MMLQTSKLIEDLEIRRKLTGSGRAGLRRTASTYRAEKSGWGKLAENWVEGGTS